MVKWSILKDEIKKMSKDEKKLKNQIKYQTLLKKFLSLIKNSKTNRTWIKNFNTRPNAYWTNNFLSSIKSRK